MFDAADTAIEQQATTLANMGTVLQAMGDIERALDVLQQAQILFESTDNASFEQLAQMIFAKTSLFRKQKMLYEEPASF